LGAYRSTHSIVAAASPCFAAGAALRTLGDVADDDDVEKEEDDDGNAAGRTAGLGAAACAAA